MRVILLCLIIPLLSFGQIDIVGGEDANIADYPWQVGLVESSDQWITAFCGGSIIDNYWILTAAHCLDDGIEGTLYVNAGSSVYYANNGSSYSVDEIIIHPDFNSNTLNNDIKKFNKKIK